MLPAKYSRPYLATKKNSRFASVSNFRVRADINEFRRIHKDKFDDYEREMEKQTTNAAVEYVNAMDAPAQKYVLNEIFHKCDDLTGDELKSIVAGRRLQFSTEDPECISVVIYQEMWETDDKMWNGVAEMLNTWSVGDQIRKITPEENDITVVHLDIPNFR